MSADTNAFYSNKDSKNKTERILCGRDHFLVDFAGRNEALLEQNRDESRHIFPSVLLCTLSSAGSKPPKSLAMARIRAP